jgi:hypothetical protein
MTKSDIDALINATEEFTLEQARKCPRNQYGQVHIDPLLRFMFKYHWHTYCLKFVCRDLETRTQKTFNAVPGSGNSIILNTANWLMDRSSPLGIPVVTDGLVTYHNETDSGDRYFTAEITIDYKGMTIKERKSSFEVYYNKT